MSRELLDNVEDITTNAELELESIAYESVGDIASKDLRKAEVFKKWGVDFCCGGKKILIEACKAAEVDVADVIEDLKQTSESAYAPVHDFTTWSLDFLADYIYNVHHKYVRQNAMLIEELADKVAARHGDVHPELRTLSVQLKPFFEDLLHHIEKEEQLVFPYIKKLVEGGVVDNAFTSIQSPIQMMEEEHEAAGDELREFRKLTAGYSLPADACNSYRLLFNKIKEFENDLFQHIHLENNILFPKALQLEDEVLNGNNSN
jgi:regulator of cell morphogenesis and NO signaling